MSFNKYVLAKSWGDVREEVRDINLGLSQVVDAISSNSSLKVIEVSYPFGAEFIANGELFLPDDDDNLFSIHDTAVPSHLRKWLNYSPIPLGLLLNKSSEVYVDMQNRVIPLNCLNPGELFGLFESLDLLCDFQAKPIWSVSAGARSILMLPKVTNSTGCKRLKLRYKEPVSPPKGLDEHWNIITHIARSGLDGTPWRSRVLFFPREWLEKCEHADRIFFHQFLFSTGWGQSQLLRGKAVLGMLWQKFIGEVTKRNFKPTPYIADTIKHLFSIASGAAPGFKIADDRLDLVAPIARIQQAYIEDYRLKQYIPSVLHVSNVIKKDKGPSYYYYSLAYPTLLEGEPDGKKYSTSAMAELREIKTLIEALPKELYCDYGLGGAEFSFFHTDEDIFKEVSSAKLHLANDKSLLAEKATFPDREMAYNSPFLKGCVCISI